MTTRIGLMGFGRIGRNVFRQSWDREDLEVAAIVDIADPAALAYLLEYDTIFGRFSAPIEFSNGSLHVGDRAIPMLADPDPGDVDWSLYGVDIVVQATRKHRTAADCSKHLDAGARRVVLASTPEDPADMDTVIIGANDHLLGPEDFMVALGSNTSNALGPILKVLDRAFGVERAIFTVVHAFTNEQRLADVPGDDFRTSRAAAENIIPTATNSAEIIQQVLPDLQGKVSGIALNVPVADGSNVDLVAILGTETSADRVNAAVGEAAETVHVIEYTEDPIVSSDVIGNPHSAIWDGLATIVIGGTMLKGIVWFDNGWGYAARVIDVIDRLSSFEKVPT
ncbi:MAG TPA: type I glyceraldehyde-3-phosphate dehydrogenase [Acidimicrobiia bacterium]|nr:type I glyceraldehyde-3-phosphate dehydrogenase [Acidimicrobiia bacterium]